MHRCLQMTPKSTPPFDSHDDVRNLQADMDKLLISGPEHGYWNLMLPCMQVQGYAYGIRQPRWQLHDGWSNLRGDWARKRLGGLHHKTTVNLAPMQCTKAAQKAMNSLRVIKSRPTFKHFDQEAFQILYRTYTSDHIWSTVFRLGILEWERTSVSWKRFGGGQLSWSQN